jgi:cysteinyl-tRNA synthetase
VRECCEAALGLPLRGQEDTLGQDVADLVAQRDAARSRKDFPAADSIRDKLSAMGFVVEDTAQGTVVRHV